MKYSLFFLCCFSITTALAQDTSVCIFQNNTDIGNPKNAGSSLYNKAEQIYSIKGSGYNIWFERDELHYSYNKIKGDFILTANFKFEGKGTEPHRKTGWIVRWSTGEKSP